jgi:hypothetical protein
LSSRPTWLTVVLAVLTGAAGFMVAGVAALVSRVELELGPIRLPWGLVLAVAGSASLVVLARALGRAAGIAAAGGWLLGLFYVISTRPEGDYVVAKDALSYTFLVLSVLSVTVAAAWGSTS